MGGIKNNEHETLEHWNTETMKHRNHETQNGVAS